jgi:serine/threonine-protein kinase
MYVAPEALSGELVGPAADQYSLATIAYQLLTGVLPYGAKNQREMFALLLKEPPTPINKAKPGLTFAPGVEAVVMKGLAKNPKDRYPDVLSFARELATALAAPEPTETPGLFGKVRKLFG